MIVVATLLLPTSYPKAHTSPLSVSLSLCLSRILFVFVSVFFSFLPRFGVCGEWMDLFVLALLLLFQIIAYSLDGNLGDKNIQDLFTLLPLILLLLLIIRPLLPPELHVLLLPVHPLLQISSSCLPPHNLVRRATNTLIHRAVL